MSSHGLVDVEGRTPTVDARLARDDVDELETML